MAIDGIATPIVMLLGMQWLRQSSQRLLNKSAVLPMPSWCAVPQLICCTAAVRSGRAVACPALTERAEQQRELGHNNSENFQQELLYLHLTRSVPAGTVIVAIGAQASRTANAPAAA